MSERDVTVPAWLLGTGGAPDYGPSGRRGKVSASERTVTGIAAALKASVFSEKLAARDGLLQGMDPRMKTVCLLALLLAAALSRHPSVLAALYVLTVILAAASMIPVSYFIKRVWLFVPIFAGIIILPSLFNVVRDGDPLLVIWDFGREVRLGPWSLGESLAITRQGLYGGIMLLLRVAVSVSLAVLLALTTRWSDLLKALRVFHVPRVFILILSMTYRYIYLLLTLATDMFTARRSRSVGTVRSGEERRFAAAGVGTLLGKSHALSEDVYEAMISRGYTGEPESVRRFSMSGSDWLMGMALLFVAAAVVGGERLLG